jgi:hypothetical protein
LHDSIHDYSDVEQNSEPYKRDGFAVEEVVNNVLGAIV